MNDNVKQFSLFYYSNVRSNLKNTFDAAVMRNIYTTQMQTIHLHYILYTILYS